jgi:hypothetical protein
LSNFGDAVVLAPARGELPFILDGLSGGFGILTRITQEKGVVVNEFDSFNEVVAHKVA